MQPKFDILANCKNPNKLKTVREPGNRDKGVVNDFQQ